jgi:SAM-dependent methyltransferase
MAKSFWGKLKKEAVSGPTVSCGESLAAGRDLRDWYSHGLGRVLAREENAMLESVLPALFGYHLVQLGQLYEPYYLRESHIRHKVVIDADLELRGELNSLYAQPQQLPLASDSVDVVVMPHTLELHPEPHQILREAERILVPEGHVVLLVFNPWSFWGLRRSMTPTNKRQAPWCCRFINPIRTKDWLQVLGFELCSVKTFFHRPPINRSHLHEYLSFVDQWGGRLWPAFGAVTMYVAKKQVIPVTPIVPRWQRRRRILTPGLLETRDGYNRK